MNNPVAITGEAEKPVKVSGWILTFFVMIAAVIGLAPVALFLGRPQLMLYFAAGGGLIAASYLFSERKTTATHSPALWEIALAGLGAISLWGFLGFLWIGLYQVIYWIARIVFTDPTLVVYYITLAFASIFAIGVAIANAQSMVRQLYSVRPGARSVFYTQLMQKRDRPLMYPVLVLLFLAAEAVGLWLIRGSSNTAFYILLQLIPYMASAPLLILSARSRRESNVVEAVSKLITSLGYTVICAPRTGDEALDSLLGSLDLIAYDEERAFAIDIKTSNTSLSPVDWTAASSLRMKAKALGFSDASKKLGLPSLDDKEIQPLMVLVDRKQDDSLIEFCKEESFPVETIETDLINQVLETKDQNYLADLAGSKFHYVGRSKFDTASASNSIGG